jgi:hypothetical protein
LKGRIFAADASPEKTNQTVAAGIFAWASESHSALWLKLAPVCCVLLLTLFLGLERQGRSGYLAVASGSNVLAGLSSNMLALCATDMRAQHENDWTAVTFDWTKTSRYLSTTDPFVSPWKTNGHKL